MGVYVATPKTGLVRNVCERSLRLCLLTDASSAEGIPEEVRAATDEVRFRSLAFEHGSEGQADATLAWMCGDQLLRGSAAEIRNAMYARPVIDAEVVVHLPYIEEADLLCVQPRILRRGAAQAHLVSGLHIASAATPSPAARAAVEKVRAPWARLYSALLTETKRTGASLDALKELWQTPKQSTVMAALILRNMALVLMRCEQYARAEELLELGTKAFAGYSDIAYLLALLQLTQGKRARALPHLEAAMRMPDIGYVGSGGINSYRSAYIIGSICEQVGEQEKACLHWRSALVERPTFAPSLAALLKQRMPRPAALSYAWPMAEAARREPEFMEGALGFMLEHDLPDSARLLIADLASGSELRTRFERATQQCEQRLRPRAAGSPARPGVRFTGPLFDASGHARINRAVGASLMACGSLDAGLDPSHWPSLRLTAVPNGEELLRGTLRHPASIDLTIRHVWPPDFLRPAGGKLACILPWEHSTVPVGWVSEIQTNVDELWVPSEFVRQAFLSGGVSAARVKAIANGVDAGAFHAQGTRYRPPMARSFVFLYVGGTIRRKGIDALLRAYGDAFTRGDDATLVVKDVGSRSFYAHNSRLNDVLEFTWRAGSPHTLVLSEEMNDSELAALYRGADAFVMPFRGEGFGMPLAEAMACGTPVITTGAGPALEFCDAEDSYLIPAKEVPVPEPPPPLGEFSGPWTWFEPDVVALAQTMRQVYEHREEAKQRGMRASERIRNTLAWEKILPLYHERIAALTQED